MKRYSLLLLLFLVCSVGSASARDLWAFLSYSAFNSPEGPYIETYLSIAGNSVRFMKQPDGKYQAAVNILMTFKQNDEIKAFKKYELKSPVIADTNKVDFQFVDQQRFQLPNGNYDFEVQLSDQNKDVKATPYMQVISVDFPADKPSLSGIELVKSYKKSEAEGILTKSGYDLVPYVYTFYPEHEQSLAFYCEVYNMNKVTASDQKYLLSYYIETFESNFRLNDFARVKKEVARPVGVILAEMNLSNLATGNYNLVVEVRDQQNNLLASRKLFIQRSNPNMPLSLADIQQSDISGTFVAKITNADTLREYIRSTRPIADGLEVQYMKGPLKMADLVMLQQYFYNFWKQRKPSDPEGAWNAYNLEVRKVQASFGTPVKKGYETDRGRVYLEYGPPSQRVTSYYEPTNYPYEIWQYYSTIGNQLNRKFVFWSEDRVLSDFTLLHSDAKGEIYNPRWQVDLTSRTQANVDLQDTQVINVWGDMQKDYWDLPY